MARYATFGSDSCGYVINDTKFGQVFGYIFPTKTEVRHFLAYWQTYFPKVTDKWENVYEKWFNKYHKDDEDPDSETGFIFTGELSEFDFDKISVQLHNEGADSEKDKSDSESD